MPRGRSDTTAEVWRDRVVRWKQSGLTARQFAEREGIERPSALSWWQHRFKQQKAVAKEPPPLKLLRLDPVTSVAAPEISIEVQCGSHRVLIRHDFDALLLRRVLDVLEDSQ